MSIKCLQSASSFRNQVLYQSKRTNHSVAIETLNQLGGILNRHNSRALQLFSVKKDMIRRRCHLPAPRVNLSEVVNRPRRLEIQLHLRQLLSHRLCIRGRDYTNSLPRGQRCREVWQRNQERASTQVYGASGTEKTCKTPS